MARKLPGLQRVLETPSLAAVAYGEIASSLFFALGVVAVSALGFTPWVLLLVGALFLVVALSYAEGTAAIPETDRRSMLPETRPAIPRPSMMRPKRDHTVSRMRNSMG